MTDLRRKMLENMQLRGLKPKTQESYISSVRQLAEYYHRSPDRINDNEIRNYFLYLINERKLASKTIKVKLNGMYFFYNYTLNRKLPILDFIRSPKCRKLPVVLAREEVQAILHAIKQPVHRMCLSTIYCCGLRISEGVNLQTNALDGRRRLLKVIQGKGSVDRLVPLPSALLKLLRNYWKTERPSSSTNYLFPNKYGIKAVNTTVIQRTTRMAVRAAKINKSVCVHTLRHSYATNLLELGVDIRVIQSALGHKSLATTSNYIHLTAKATERFKEALDIMSAVL